MQSLPKLSTVAEHADPHVSYDHRKYLTDAGFEKTTSSDESQAEEVEDNEEEDEEEAEIDPDTQSFIGISIGAEQTRLASPSTPAAEKAAAIGDDPFARALEQIEQEPAARRSRQESSGFGSIDATAKDTSQPRLPSPWRSGGRQLPPQSDGTFASAWRSVLGNRPRASSGPSSSTSDRHERKLLPISLPSLPKMSHSHRVSFPTVDTALAWLRSSISDDTANPTRNGNRSIQPLPTHGATAAEARRTSFAEPRAVTSHGNAKQIPHPAPLLRRSTSDGSLVMARTLSRASSLGDDSRWQNVHEQVNSRMKAIKDSLADSNLKMPRFRPAWLDMNFGPKSSEDLSTANMGINSRDFGHSRNMSEGGRLKSLRTVPARDSPVSPPPGMTKQNAEAHPQFSRALKRLTGDLVILGGYRGSVLRSAEPPHRQLWVPIKVGLGVRKVNLEVGLEPEDDENMESTIIPSGMLKNIGPVEISRRLFKRLQMSKNARNGTLRIWDYGYDWRLSPHVLSRQLQKFLEGLPSNQSKDGTGPRGAMIVAHSLGGLITRHVINNRPELCSGVVYAGVPQACVNILGPLRNGDAVLLSSKVLTAQVNFTIRTSFALLPLDGKCFIDRETKEEYRVDFFDPKTWDEYNLSPCISKPLPPLSMTPESQGVVSQLVGSMASVLPNVSFGKNSSSKRSSVAASPVTERGSSTNLSDASRDTSTYEHSSGNVHMEPQMDQNKNPQQFGQSEEKNISTAVTIPKEDAVKYLTRTLSEVKRFKQELDFKPELEEKYPPAAVIYGKSTPTVYGAGVHGREGIKHADAYENLLFASGDGVVLARASQIPNGYHVVKGGVVSSDRGHISLLGDLEAVGSCFNAILRDQKRRARVAAANKETNK